MSATLRQLWPTEFDRLWDVARRLGWSYNWSRGVIDQFVPAVVAWSSTPIGQLNAEHLDGFEAAFAGVTSASTTTRKQWHGRLFGVRQLLFECGQIDEPPKRGPRGATIEDRLATVAAAEIRDAMARYVRARSAVLSRSSVDGLVNDLIPFGLFLSDHHPNLTRLAQLERHHIEDFLVWNRARCWRGRVARDQQVSASVVHNTMLTLRNFLDDITLWGGPTAPHGGSCSRQTYPGCPDPCPGRWPLTSMPRSPARSSRSTIPSPARRCWSYDVPGCGSVSASTCRWPAWSTTGPPAHGYGFRWASSAPNVPFPLTRTALPRSMPG
jgi:hypothetical protein